ncbi:sugar-binding transcriptional regulator [Thermoanaerobacterium sp. DL9XJH110]|uniref:sugar-binding transcriptional regulator n=1 Tax=Thermoanaerobacterium sp. DL9XJH110 TaxID=3386643 RepID=UPI003BB75739
MVSNWKDTRLLIRIAHMYYEENKTQQEIANKLGVSRPSVSRLLQKAREEGIVEIKISYEGSFTKLEDTLEKTFGLKEAVITPFEEGEGLKRLLAEAAAAFLVRALKDKDVVGVSWGTTLAYIPEFLKSAPKLNVTFVPLVGGVGQTRLDVHSNQIVINLARAFNGSWQLLHAPAIVDSIQVRDTILSDKNIKQVLEVAQNASVAIIGIGSPLNPSSTMRETGYFSETVLEELKKGGAVCDMCSRFLDKNGDLCPVQLNQRVIGVSIESIKKIPLVIGVAGGPDKHEAILAALKGNLLDVLITDEKTGNFLLGKI